jgi:hypothetical protein
LNWQPNNAQPAPLAKETRLGPVREACTDPAVYDPFIGDAIDEKLWTYLTAPQPGKSDWICVEPSAITRVGEGTLDIHVQRFAPIHDSSQTFGGLRHQLVATKPFDTEDRRVTFDFEVAATRVGDPSTDFGNGFASFMVFDGPMGWSFRVCCDGIRDFGLYDSLRCTNPAVFPADVIKHAVRRRGVGIARRHEVTLSGPHRLLEWRVDGQLAWRAADIAIPRTVQFALGLSMLSTVGPRVSRHSPAAPGLSVSFGPTHIRTEIA